MKQTRLIAQLEQARDLIAKPGTWVKRRRKVKRAPIPLLERLAGGQPYAYCALGALDKARGGRITESNEDCDPLVLALYAALPPKARWGHDKHRNVYYYNDTHEQHEVISLFNRAIELQREHPMERE